MAGSQRRREVTEPTEIQTRKMHLQRELGHYSFPSSARTIAAFGFKLVFASLTFVLTAQVCFSQNIPQVLKVDPPSWWADHSINPMRALFRGANLRGARVTGAPGLRIGASSVNSAGTYLFADVQIDPQAKPGTRRLRITTSGGSTEASFEVLQPLARAGRFQGFSPDDVIYLIMIDRFSDGDPANNDPAQSR